MTGAVAIIVAAGRSTRFGGGVPKQFLDLGGEIVAARAAHAMMSCSAVSRCVIVVPEDAMSTAATAKLRALPGVCAVVPGGSSRMASALAGVEAASDAEFVLVHDAARPFVSDSLVFAVLDAARKHGAAVPAVRALETVKRDDGTGFVVETLDRTGLRIAQTPQAARRDWMLEALRLAVASGFEVTDEAQALERVGRRVALVPGDPSNVKITTPSDWTSALSRVSGEDTLRVGHGYDVHRFGGSRVLVLGGMTFPGERGLLGHSDADVVLHAAMDALLGAAGLSDIGHFFPPDDPRFAGSDSALLAREVAGHLAAAGFRVANLDVTVLAEGPRIRDRVGAMREAVAACFLTEPSRVGVKATTLEGLGALGRGEGIACHAVALLRRIGGLP